MKKPQKVFYARGSNDKIDRENQLLELRKKWGDLPVHEESISSREELIDRVVLDRLLKTLPKGSTIYTLSIDRISRNLYEMMSILFGAEKREIRIVTVKEGDLAESNKLLTAMHAYVAEEERKKISERVKAAIKNKRRNYGGKWGAQLHKVQKVPVRKANPIFEEARPFVESMRESGLLQREIAALATSRFGVRFDETRISRMLKRA